MKPDQIKYQIDALDFVQTELELYLDVHPMDETARNQWMKNAQELDMLERRYTEMTGTVWPMTQNRNGGTLAWVTEPWPWDNQY